MQLTVSSLSLRFGDRTVFDGASLQLSGPGLHAIIGPSGSGKSSLLAVVAGHVPADDGEAAFVVAGDAIRKPRVAWIVQSSPLLTRRTVLDNVALGPLSRGVDSIESMRRSLAALTSLGMTGFAQTKVHRLSGGERQRVTVARCLSSEAELILADEPTASLDERARDAVFSSLLKAKEAGAFVLIATHDLVVARRCDSAHRIEDGKFVRV